MERHIFGQRLSALRIQKGVSARNMSLSLGQSYGYINNIENGNSLPSMPMFFCICEYLGVTPAEFCDAENHTPSKIDELCSLAKRLNEPQVLALLALARELDKSNKTNCLNR